VESRQYWEDRLAEFQCALQKPGLDPDIKSLLEESKRNIEDLLRQRAVAD
jgi:hypothetical protein